MNKSNSNLSIKGFTLAEVLITLTIIGVVASITMPTLIQQKNNNEIKARVKKSYATLSNAFELAKAEHGDFDSWDWASLSEDPNKILDIIAPHLNIKEKCGTDNGCVPNVTYKYLGGDSADNYSTSTYFAKARLSDGSSLMLITGSSSATIYIDINGDMGPNQWGHDLFVFELEKNGLVPYNSSAKCSVYGENAGCGGYGYTCAARIIYDDDVSYLKEEYKVGVCKNAGSSDDVPCTSDSDCTQHNSWAVCQF